MQNLFEHSIIVKKRGGAVVIAERIKILREMHGMTQTELAKRLGITRSGVNAWEMGVSAPSTQYIVELAFLFGVSTDYLLGIPNTATVSVKGLSDEEIASIVHVIRCYQNKGQNNV